MDQAAILVVLLSVCAQQHEVALQGIKVLILNKD